MTTYFVKMVKLFSVPDQVAEDEDTVMDHRYEPVANLPFPLIDWDEWEVDDLDIISKLVEARTKEWIDGKISLLKQQGITLTYEELEEEPISEIDSWMTATPMKEDSQSPPVTRSRKRKEVAEK